MVGHGTLHFIIHDNGVYCVIIEMCGGGGVVVIETVVGCVRMGCLIVFGCVVFKCIVLRVGRERLGPRE
jgi:hypothetical protein